MSKFLVNTLLILIIILIFSCKDSPFSNSSTTQEAETTQDTVAQEPEAAPITEIYTWVNELRMREEPTTNSPIVVTLKEGEPLDYEGTKSDFTEKISLRGTLFNEPWLKVTTKTGKEGWVYGGGVKFYKVGADKSGTPYDDCFKLVRDRKVSQSKKCFERVQFRQLNFAVEATYKDSSEYVLVNDKSGELLTLRGYPKASPDGNHIVGVNVDWKGVGEAFNGIQLISYVDDGFKVVFEEEIIGYNPVTPKWIDDNTLQINLLQEDNRRKSKLAQLKKEETGEWIFDY